MSSGAKRKREEVLPLDPAALDPASPAAYYLPRESLANLADVELIVKGGQRLPAHQAFLAAASPVLEAAFSGQAEGRATRSSKGRPRSQAAAATELSVPFSSFSLEEVALFLRVGVYSPVESSYDLEEVSDHLPALLRLAHALEAERLLSSIVDCVAENEDADVEHLVTMLRAADDCQLEQGRRRMMRVLVGRWLAGGTVLAKDAAAVVRALSQDALAELVGAFGSGRPAKPASFGWKVDGFSKIEGQSISSPEFYACGARWCLELFPRGEKDSEEGFLSLYLECLSDECFPLQVHPTFYFKGSSDKHHIRWKHSQLFRYTEDDNTWGSDMAQLTVLRDEARGHLSNDTLHIEVHIRTA